MNLLIMPNVIWFIVYLCNILGFSNSAIPTHKKSIDKIDQHNIKAIPNHRIVKITH